MKYEIHSRFSHSNCIDFEFETQHENFQLRNQYNYSTHSVPPCRIKNSFQFQFKFKFEQVYNRKQEMHVRGVKHEGGALGGARCVDLKCVAHT